MQTNGTKQDGTGSALTALSMRQLHSAPFKAFKRVCLAKATRNKGAASAQRKEP